MLPSGIEIDSGWVDADAGARDDLEPAPTLLHVLSGNLAFSTDNGVHLRGFSLPAFRLDPGIYDHDLQSGAEPFEDIRLKFLYQYSTKRHDGARESLFLKMSHILNSGVCEV